jgi:hypothetical protein
MILICPRGRFLRMFASIAKTPGALKPARLELCAVRSSEASIYNLTSATVADIASFRVRLAWFNAIPTMDALLNVRSVMTAKK